MALGAAPSRIFRLMVGKGLYLSVLGIAIGLLAAGIAAEIHRESKVDEKLDLSRVTAGVRIEVPRGDFETALGIVYDWNAAPDAETTLPGVPRGTTTGSAGSSPSSPS